MLGRIEVPSDLRIGSYEISVRAENGFLTYRRVDSSAGEERRYVLSRGIELRAVPMYPIFYPRFITQFILCVLEHEIVVAPGASIRVSLEIPVDVAIYAYSGNSFKIIDVLALHKDAKYVLYGTTYGGTVARFCVARLTKSVNDVEFGYAYMPLTIKNCMGRVARVSKVLLDASPLRLYYREGSKWYVATQSITMNIVTDTSAIVYYEKPVDPRALPIDDPESLRPPRVYNRTDMLQGY
ncbi:MAG: DUF432 domain-containing protein [Crenarchaeota archaeon]|nr:DUF432 domain-containing protein [Thermoproteota archaeon]